MPGLGLLTCSRTLVATASLLLASAGGAMAHSFSVGLLMPGAQDEARLTSAVRGFLVASAERDGHSDETSDGHIGGLDVDIVPLLGPNPVAMKELKGASADQFDLIVSLGGPAPDMASGQTPVTIVLEAGTLPENWSSAAGPNSFANRYRAAYGAEPDQAAASGYNAARRIERAVRPLGGVDDRDALAAALAKTADGTDW